MPAYLNRPDLMPFNLIGTFFTALLLSNCGVVSTGGGSGTFTDAVPNGTVVAQGNFSSQNGQTVTGSAIIYNMGAPNYIVRLSGLTAPSESGLLVQVWGNGSSPTYQVTLRGASGNQNYSFSSNSQSFSRVCIHSNLKQLDYGCALLQ